MDNNKKGNTVLLTVIAVATLLVAVVGATFAYFTATVTGNDTASSVVVSTAKVGTITYTNGNELTLTNAYPGATASITFTVASANDSTTNVKYGIAWDSITNGFVTKSDLVYTLTGSNSGNAGTVINVASETQVPDTAGTIASTGVLAPGETHTYTLTVTFKETGVDQNSNQGKNFVGRIQVNTGDTETYYNDANKSGTSTQPTAPQAQS